METAYREWEKRRQTSQTRRRTADHRRTGGQKELGIRERRRLLQLAVCAVLFLMVFIGKGVFPDKLADMRDKVLGVIRADTDFRAAFSSLGASISTGEPVIDTLENLWINVFGGGTVTVAYTNPLDHPPLYETEKQFLNPASGVLSAGTAFHYLDIAPPIPAPIKPAELAPTPASAPPEPPATPVTPAVEQMAYEGPALPKNASMDKYNLGLSETATPVLGRLSSSFGWREHPVDGLEKFHNGVDLAVNNGTAVGAFADGVVDYIGESSIYGQYLQIHHAGGLTSFYAHCSKLCVQQGQTVRTGETVAESGATGNATGPHLHLELKREGILINPIYYIKTE